MLSSKARNITIVLHDLPLGGTERIAIRLANRWAAEGRRVTVLCGERRGALGGLIDQAVEVVECDPPIPRGRGSRKALGRATARFVAERRPDVLFIPGNYHWPVMPAVAALPEGQRPAIVAQVSTPLYRHGRGPLAQIAYNLRTRRQFKGIDLAISLSPSMTSDIDWVLRRRITQCLRLPALEDEAVPLTFAAGKLIVAAGRFVPEKGFDLALRAFARLNDPHARLALVGDGPERPHLITLAQDLGIAAQVDFPGCVPDIRPWLEQSRALLLTSWYEGYAAVVIEALAAGRPVVCTQSTPAALELVNQPGAGAIAPIGDVEALAAGLSQVLAAPAPPPARLAALVAGYRIGAIARSYLRLFDEAVLARRAEVRAPASVRAEVRPVSPAPAARPATASMATSSSA